MTTRSAEPGRPPDPLVAQALGLARKVDRLASEAGRESLLEKLRADLNRPQAAATTVVFCGESNRGKSALINALLGRPGLLPVSAERSTATHVVVHNGSASAGEAALAHRLGGESVAVPLEELADWITDSGPAERQVDWIEVTLHHPLLAKGLTLVDTPGVGGLGRAHGRLALSVLASAEAGLLVIDAGAPISAPELAFLDQALGSVVDLVVVLNRIDGHKGWREVMQESAGLLARQPSKQLDETLFPVSARMKSRADALRGSEGDLDLAAELEGGSGIPALADRLERWAGTRSSALRAVRLCQLGERVVERSGEMESVERMARDASDEQLAARLSEKSAARDDLARELPAARRRLAQEFRLLPREIDAALSSRVSTLRRDFERRLAEGEDIDLENDLEAELIKALEEALEEVRARLEAATAELRTTLDRYRARIELESSEFGWEARPDLGLVEALPVKAVAAELVGRVPFTLGAALFNPLYAVAGLAGLVFDFRRMRQRGQRDQLSRQVGETVNEARVKMSLAVYQALVTGQELLTEALEEAGTTAQKDLGGEIEALKARAAQSRSERKQGAAGVDQRLQQLSELRAQLAHTREAAADALHVAALTP